MITYQRGSKYEPDFLVETANLMPMCEVKAAKEMQDAIVQARANAARTWVGAANAVAQESGRKQWHYVLIPHRAIAENATLQGLLSAYGQKSA